MGRADLLAAAIKRFGFRLPLPGEAPEVYWQALVRHVNQRDWAAAFELRLGRPQAEWSSADAEAFKADLLARPHSTHDLSHGAHIFRGIEDPGHAVTVAEIESLADRMVDFLAAQRAADPARELAVLVSVLLTTGTLITFVTGSDERIGLVKAAAQTQPVFGFVVGTDAFIHVINTAEGTKATTATKRDAIVVHSGSRDHRVMRCRGYGLAEGRVQFDPTKVDDMRGWNVTHDPYADVFVTVPPSSGKPS